jgi:hypothetical protein
MVMWRCPGCEFSLFCHVCVNIGLGRSGWSFSSCLFDKISGLMNAMKHLRSILVRLMLLWDCSICCFLQGSGGTLATWP